MSAALSGRALRTAGGLVLLLAACATAESTQGQFDRHYQDWLREQSSVSFSSRTDSYTALPSFRAIVAMGPPVVPVIRAHLERRSCKEDFFLASAILDIRGWRRETLGRPGDDSEQGLCREVLRKLAAEAAVSRP